MTRNSRFRVTGRFDMASQIQEATVVIERASALIAVRPLRRKRVYSLPLATVAEWVVRRILQAEVAAKKAEKKARKTSRGLLRAGKRSR